MYPVLLSLLLAAGLAPQQQQQQQKQDRRTVGVEVPGGKVSVSYTPTALRGRSIDKDLKAGDVWRMSAGPAAELVTGAPLIAGTTVIAPGRYRLSSRYLGRRRFTLMLFRGPAVYERGVPYRELPLRLHEEERAREQLSLRLRLDREEGPEGEVRFSSRWGKHSLNWNLQVLPMHRARWTLAGKPATLTFFGLPRHEKIVDQVKAGIRVHFGMLVQEDKGIRYDLFGVHTRRGYYVECRNFTVPDNRLHIEAQEATAARIQELIEKGAGLEQRLESLREAIDAAKKVLDEAESLPRKVRIQCQLQRNPEPGRSLRVETSDTGNGKIRVLLHFGLRTAACVLDPGEFDG